MLTKTFRAQNMLAALKSVQADLGPDAMIISMREVPAGPIWAAWKKPGVEVIASKSTKQLDANASTINEESEVISVQNKIHTPSSEELKKEIENLKMLVTGQKNLLPVDENEEKFNTKQKQFPTPVNNKTEEHHFDIDDFKSLREVQEPQFDRFVSRTKEVISKTPVVVVENQKPDLPPNLLEIKDRLIDQGIKIEFVDKIINTNLDALSPSILNDFERLDRFIKHQLVVCLPPNKKSLALVPSRIMVLAGTSGSGKTSCCAKLASFYMITMGKKVVWIEADTVKTSAIAEARTYTETLGIPLFLAYTPQELSELISSQSDADLILIDTASCNPRNEDSVVELGSFLSIIPSGSTYLVSSATTKEQDVIQIEKALKQFGLKGLILTKTDETGFFGSYFNLLHKSKMPLYFYTTGNKIFGNLKPGSPETLVNAILSGEFEQG